MQRGKTNYYVRLQSIYKMALHINIQYASYIHFHVSTKLKLRTDHAISGDIMLAQSQLE
jgi:hypothetical protein